jgi:hypothetical protein
MCSRRLCPILAALHLILLCGCRTPNPPPIDLSDPSWSIRQGQAVWTPPKRDGRAEGVAGELLMATRADGSCWVQFAKPPFNLATAQRSEGRWHVESQQGRQSHSGRGSPPSGVIWFQLADVLSGRTLQAPWHFNHRPGGAWLLENLESGERLEGFVSP